MRAFFPAWPGKQSRVISPNSIGGFTPFTPRSGLQEIPVATRQESGVLCFPSRRGLTLRALGFCLDPPFCALPSSRLELPPQNPGVFPLASMSPWSAPSLAPGSTREIMSRKCNSWVLPNNLEVLKGVMARPRPQDTVQHTTQHTSGKP